MPSEQHVPTIQPADLENEPLKTSQERVSTQYALATVVRTFYEYETFRSQNHDKRWNVHDSLYFGWVPPRTWDGTNMPRAALGMQIVFDQVEAMVPAVTQALFNVGPEWFQVTAESGTDPQEVQGVQDSMSYCLEHPKDDVSANAVAETELAVKSVGLYGNGGVGIEWDPVKNRAVWEWVDLRDFYIDPQCPTPNVDDCRSIIRRRFMTVEQLLDLGAADGRMDMPSADVLYTMAKYHASAYADETKRVQEALRGVSYSPGASDYVPVPADRTVEVLIYYSKGKIIWVLNKQWVAYNQPNPYGFVPFAFAPCYIVPGRWYAQSIADVQEPNQRAIEGLINAHMDEVALAVHPPRAIPRGAMLTPAQQKWRPGALYAFDKPQEVNLLQPQPATTNVYTDVSYFETVADRRSGINSMSSGVPRPSNANRTASGMQMQQQGSGNRLSHLVGNIEKYLILPALYKLHKIIQFHVRAGQQLPAYSADKGRYDVDASVFYKPVRFRMNAASRMLTKDRLMQIFPFLAQYLLQGPLLEQLHATGKTLDYEVLVKMLTDATNVGQLYPLIRQMNEQEQQAAQQPPPEVAAQQQQAQQELQARMQMAQESNQTELQKAMISKQSNPMEMQIEAQKAQQEMEMEGQKNQADLFMQAMLAKIKIQAEHDKSQMDLAKKRADLQLAQQQHGQEMQQSTTSHQMKMQQMMDQLMMQKYAKDQGLQGGATGEGGQPQQAAEPTGGQPKQPANRPRKKAEERKKERPAK